jgi:RNA polymerase sigma-70 factor (sigma-E family)
VDLQFEEWARARTPSLLRSAYLLTGGQHSAEDLVQSALERVLLAWDRILEHPDAYVRVVLYRENVGRWRRRRVHEVSATEGHDPGVADRTGQVETSMLLHSALARLTARQRAVLVLRFYDDLAESEVASILGCSVGTVKSQTHKALRALRAGAPELGDLIGERELRDV